MTKERDDEPVDVSAGLANAAKRLIKESKNTERNGARESTRNNLRPARWYRVETAIPAPAAGNNLTSGQAILQRRDGLQFTDTGKTETIYSRFALEPGIVLARQTGGVPFVFGAGDEAAGNGLVKNGIYDGEIVGNGLINAGDSFMITIDGTDYPFTARENIAAGAGRMLPVFVSMGCLLYAACCAHTGEMPFQQPTSNVCSGENVRCHPVVISSIDDIDGDFWRVQSTITPTEFAAGDTVTVEMEFTLLSNPGGGPENWTYELSSSPLFDQLAGDIAPDTGTANVGDVITKTVTARYNQPAAPVPLDTDIATIGASINSNDLGPLEAIIGLRCADQFSPCPSQMVRVTIAGVVYDLDISPGFIEHRAAFSPLDGTNNNSGPSFGFAAILLTTGNLANPTQLDYQIETGVISTFGLTPPADFFEPLLYHPGQPIESAPGEFNVSGSVSDLATVQNLNVPGHVVTIECL